MRTALVAMAIAALALAACKRSSKRGQVVADENPNRDAAAAPAAPAASPADTARRFVEHLVAGRYDAALGMLPAEAHGKVTAEQIGGQWSQRVGDAGPAGELSVRRFPADPSTMVVRVELARGTIDLLVVVKDGAVVTIAPGFVYQPPDYVDRAAFTDVEFPIGSGATALPGVLSVPRGPGPFPVVVLEAGSGPSDLDEFDGHLPLYLFRDLAWGLASKGVAVLRHDKRSFAIHFLALGVPVEQFTVEHEYFADLSLALTALAHDPRVDPARIFVLGHSQAGWLLPWMLRDHPEVAGGIIASGCAHHLADVIAPQNQYLAGLQGATAEQLTALAAIDAAKQARAHDPDLPDDTPATDLPIGVPARYWKHLAGYDALAVVAGIDRPLLLLQGGRDYNVPVEEHQLWKQALASHRDVTAHLYPTLEHHYLAGTGRYSTPAELAGGGHAGREVIDDIAAWVAAH